MVRKLTLGGLFILAATTQALANGRAPATSTINFRQGNEQHIAAGMTFGLVLSTDGGTTWRWMCENAVKYGGMYDPDYAYSSTGALFATTFGGGLVNRDGCVFQPGVFGEKFVSTVTVGPDGDVYSAITHPANPTISDPGDAKIYKSTDNGMTFPTSANPGLVGDWWSSLEVAPSDPDRVYLTGYRLGTTNRTHLLFKSINGGTSFTAMNLTGITTTMNSTIEIVGISKTNPDHIFVRVDYQNPNAISDGLFRSIDAGVTWTKILEKQDQIAFVVRRNGDLVAGTRNSGSFVSRAPSNGDAWETLPTAPHINCLTENAAQEVWACTSNFGAQQVPSDEAGIMKTTDLATWTKVLRYQDIQAPVECPAGTAQHDECAPMWCALKAQLGIIADPTSCASVFDVPSDGQTMVTPPPKSCCSSGDNGGGPTVLAISSAVGMVLLRRRRRR